MNTPRGPDGPPEASQVCSRWCKFTVLLLWRWMTFTAFCWCLYLARDSSSFVLARLPEHAARFQRAEIILWSSRGLMKGRAGGLKSTWEHCFLRHAACLSDPQRVPSWFSSVQSVITVAGWLHNTMRISQHSQCFPCVVSFLLYSDSLRLCALKTRMKTSRPWFDISPVSVARFVLDRTGHMVTFGLSHTVHLNVLN